MAGSGNLAALIAGGLEYLTARQELQEQRRQRNLAEALMQKQLDDEARQVAAGEFNRLLDAGYLPELGDVETKFYPGLGTKNIQHYKAEPGKLTPEGTLHMSQAKQAEATEAHNRALDELAREQFQYEIGKDAAETLNTKGMYPYLIDPRTGQPFVGPGGNPVPNAAHLDRLIAGASGLRIPVNPEAFKAIIAPSLGGLSPDILDTPRIARQNETEEVALETAKAGAATAKAGAREAGVAANVAEKYGMPKAQAELEILKAQLGQIKAQTVATLRAGKMSGQAAASSSDLWGTLRKNYGKDPTNYVKRLFTQYISSDDPYKNISDAIDKYGLEATGGSAGAGLFPSDQAAFEAALGGGVAGGVPVSVVKFRQEARNVLSELKPIIDAAVAARQRAKKASAPSSGPPISGVIERRKPGKKG
jgi:hypothetical protein